MNKIAPGSQPFISTDGQPRVSIGLFGNMCNWLFQIAMMLRNGANIDAHLYLDRFECVRDVQNLPERDDPSLLNNYPAWIHLGNYVDPRYIIAPFLSPLVRELNQYDLVILSGSGPMFAPFIKSRTVFFVGGGDLTIFPFPFRQLKRYKGPVAKLAAIIRSFWQTMGIRSVDEICSQPFAPFRLAEQRLKVQHKVSPAYFPIVIDEKVFAPDAGTAIRQSNAQMDEVKKKFDFVIFHPSRINDDCSPYLVETGEWKNNSLLLRALKILLERDPSCGAVLVLVDKSNPQGRYSLEEQRFRSLIENLGLTTRVIWLKPSEGGGFPRWELASLYRDADVVIDEFGIGWFGSIVLEALGSGKPVICHVDENVMLKLYQDHPILSFSSAESVAACLHKLLHNEEYRKVIGRESREWILRNHTGQAVKDRYLANLRRVCFSSLPAK